MKMMLLAMITLPLTFWVLDSADAAVSGQQCVGAKGDQGIPGVAGPPGIRGAIGRQGPPGIPGGKGSKGAAGDEGPHGKPGQQGVQGVIGYTGPTGQQGPAGATGPPGPVGVRGPKGHQGTHGHKGDRGFLGPRGLPGVDGVPGNAGPFGAPGPHGPEGVKGERGGPGQKGNQGVQGSPGPEMSEGILKRYFAPVKNLSERVQSLENRNAQIPVAAYLYGSDRARHRLSGIVTKWRTTSPSYLLGGVTYSNGVIVLPADGLYYIYLNVFIAIRSRDTRLTMRVNGNGAAETGHYDDRSSNEWEPNYVAVILQLKKGDRVDVYANGGEYFTGGPYTYFGVYKLH